MNDTQTTPEVLKATAPDLTYGLSDDTLNQLITDARLQVLASGFPKVVESADGEQVPIREIATRDLALHLVTMDDPAGEGIASEQVSVIQRTFVNKTNIGWLESSVWGQMYLYLLENYANGQSRLNVIQH